jgi:hypothetical protein
MSEGHHGKEKSHGHEKFSLAGAASKMLGDFVKSTVSAKAFRLSALTAFLLSSTAMGLPISPLVQGFLVGGITMETANLAKSDSKGGGKKEHHTESHDHH